MKNLDLQIDNKYRLIRKLGKGSFGAVYLAKDVDTGKEVAVKLEHCTIELPFLREEFDFYKKLEGGKGFPNVYWFGHQCEYQAMVFELLGPTLEDLFRYCGRIFSLKTVLMLADQLILRFQYLHSNNILHKDIKPANFLMGVGENGNCVYLTDLGLARERIPLRAPYPGLGVPIQLIGTAAYASINAHRGIQQSQRDDMESLGYMLLDFLKGRLPWDRVRGTTTKEIYRLIMAEKESTSLDVLCSDVPVEFRIYMQEIRDLKHGEKPNYSKLRRMFNGLFLRSKFEHDNVFDWTVRKYIESLHQSQQETPATE